MVPGLKPAESDAKRRSFWHACRAWMRTHGQPRQSLSPAAEHLTIGRRGERRAYEYLCGQGYTIVARNYRQPGSREEIGFIAWEGGELVMIEVKTRGADDWRGPEAGVDADKLRHLRKLAGSYARRHGIARFRLDVLAIEGTLEDAPLIRLHRGKNEAAHAPG